jgi:Tfp pilus assembly protein PilV
MRFLRRSGAGVRWRSAFTVVEVLVALVLVTVGLLGIAGNCALAIRVSGAAARERRATQRAANRVAMLSSDGCRTARSGSLVDSSAMLIERWTVTAPNNGVALVDAGVQWVAAGASRSVLLRSAILC